MPALEQSSIANGDWGHSVEGLFVRDGSVRVRYAEGMHTAPEPQPYRSPQANGENGVFRTTVPTVRQVARGDA